MQEHVGTNFTHKDVSDYLWSTLKSGRVVPGYGHAVLRKPDPRFEALMDYASSRPEIANDPVFQLVKKNSEIAPIVLTEHGKTKVSNRETLLHVITCSLVNLCALHVPPVCPVRSSNCPLCTEPASKCRFELWSALPPLWIPRDVVLYCYFRCQPRPGSFGTIDLGPSIGSPYRATEEHQPGRPPEVG
jgi:hypothetical protein